MSKFSSQPMTSALALVLFAVLVLNFATAFGREKDKTYRCTAKDAVAVQADGSLTKDDPGADIRRKHFDQMVIDLPGGDITYPSELKRENRVVQRTGALEDYVLVSKVYFGRNKGAANATTDFIRVHFPTGKSQALFVAYQLSYLVTGTCDIAR
ncbi:MAG TPA: hypothetical protein VGF53_11305 [Pseudolabrys sp.]|jgi:hypothetical protein